MAAPTTSHAVPSFVRQTGLQCTACHTAYPQLNAFGHELKLDRNFFDGGDSKLPQISFMVQPSFTHTQKSQPGGAAPHFDDNDKPALSHWNLSNRVRAGKNKEIPETGLAGDRQWFRSNEAEPRQRPEFRIFLAAVIDVRETYSMAYELTDFCRDARAALVDDPGTAGRRKLIPLLEKLLANEAFVADHLGPDEPSGVAELYKDPDLGFVVLAHVNRKASKNTPHDHGPSWAVYGMARNFTDMTEYRRVKDGPVGETEQVEKTKAYRLEQGKATLFDTGVIHALDRSLETRLVRVTGADLDTVLRHRFNLETGKVTPMPPTVEVSRRNMDAA